MPSPVPGPPPAVVVRADAPPGHNFSITRFGFLDMRADARM
jgi:hypothetical protein